MIPSNTRCSWFIRMWVPEKGPHLSREPRGGLGKMRLAWGGPVSLSVSGIMEEKEGGVLRVARPGSRTVHGPGSRARLA